MFLDLHRHAPRLKAHDSPARDQLQRVLVVQPDRPTDGKLHAFPGLKHFIRCKQHAGAGDINGFALPAFLAPGLTDGSVTQFTLNWISLGRAALAWGFH